VATHEPEDEKYVDRVESNNGNNKLSLTRGKRLWYNFPLSYKVKRVD
jgi:hypothetical protein